MGVKADNMQVGQSVTTTQNFNIRAPLDGTLRLSRGDAGAEVSDPIKIESNNDVTLAGNLLSGVLGTGQTWQLLTGSRALATLYTNTTGVSGLFRFNTDTNRFEGYNSTAWGSLGGATGGGNDDAFYENTTTITTNYTITTGKNAGSFGPITIADGVTVTVPTGSTWSIV